MGLFSGIVFQHQLNRIAAHPEGTFRIASYAEKATERLDKWGYASEDLARHYSQAAQALEALGKDPAAPAEAKIRALEAIKNLTLGVDSPLRLAQRSEHQDRIKASVRPISDSVGDIPGHVQHIDIQIAALQKEADSALQIKQQVLKELGPGFDDVVAP